MHSATVVIPTHGRPRQLERLLTSAGPGLDVVVVDDGSDAYTSVAPTFPEVRWECIERGGPAAARNHGWRRATGEVVVFVDDDVVVEPDTVERLVAELRDRDCDALGARIDPLEPGRLVADFMHAEHLVSHKVVDGEVRWLVTACVAVRRSVLDEVGGFDDHLRHAGGEDADLSLRLRAGGYRLAVSDGVAVRHDHRAGLRHLVRTYYRHGTGQRRLAARHAERRTDLGRSTRSRLSPADWRATYREYRRDQPALVALAFLVLRAAMMVPWLVGAVVGSRRRG